MKTPRRLRARLLALPLFASLLAACGSDPETTSSTTSGTSTGTSTNACELAGKGFELGDAKGHADPLGAKAAKQARAGRVTEPAKLQPATAIRERVAEGDYVLINDRIAVVIEAPGLSDGYASFGGGILTIDKVGDDGLPMGLSLYNETLMGVSFQMVNPTSVAVLKDGSDGGAAIVRVVGPLDNIPFLEGPLKALFPDEYDVQAAIDYVLEPGSPALGIRFGIFNNTDTDLDFGVNRPSQEYYGFFHTSRTSIVTPEHGYGKPEGESSWAGFDGGPWGFAWKLAGGKPGEYGIEQSGFQMFFGPGFLAPACTETVLDRAQVIAGGPEYDGLREAVREVSGEAPWRAVNGTLKDATGTAIAGAWIHVLDAEGNYLSRTRSGEGGAFTVHAPPGADVKILPQKQGYPTHEGTLVKADAGEVALAFAAHAKLHVVATDETSKEKLPVRVQVIPTNPQPEIPEAWGVEGEVNGRLYQEFAVTGEATLEVPPGEHRVIVSRGYEWELFDATVNAPAGETVEVAAPLAHSVDSFEYMCADFHIHSMFSADSSDTVVHKVKGAVADGLDIPVSSEHEWVIDFQPIIQDLGLTKWAFGVPAEELTTFQWGHFGVFPLTPRDGAHNHGAVDWIGKQPAQVFEAVHAVPEKPVLIVNHPRSSGFGGYFTSAQWDRKTNTGLPDLWSDGFDAIEVFNDSDFEGNRDASVADWFAFLNLGANKIAVGSSDSHSLRTSPVGYPRTCLYFGHDDPTKLTPNLVRDAVKSGQATVSGGLFLRVAGPNGERPGQSVKVDADGSATFTVTVAAPSWIPADTLETIVNGATVSVEPLLPLGEGPGKRFVNQVKVQLDPAAKRNWVVFHAKGETDLAPLHPGRRPFAVSNAVYLEK